MGADDRISSYVGDDGISLYVSGQQNEIKLKTVKIYHEQIISLNYSYCTCIFMSIK